MDNDINKLTKQEENGSLVTNNSNSKSFKRLNETKSRIRGLCRSLTYTVEQYNPQYTCKAIQKYLDGRGICDRISYSEISNFIFNLNEKGRATFATNVDKLLLYAIDETNGISDDCRRVAIKLYDHFNLAIKQIEIIDKRYQSNVALTKEDFNEDFKRIEREYITILGIFSSVVLAFVGALTFSTSVLENIANTNIYRTLVIVDLIGLTFIHIIYMLLNFIVSINKANIKFKCDIKKIDLFCVIFLALVILAWFIDIGLLQGHLRGMFDFWIRQKIS